MYGGSKTKICCKCNREVTVNNHKKHEASCGGFSGNKIRGIDYDPNWGYKAGVRSAWNKGLKSVPDTRNPEFIGKIGGYRPNAGRSKKFRVYDSFGKSVVLQSSYELECSIILNEMNVRWTRPRALKYDNKNYFADFYLIDFDIYLDPKNNFKAKQDEEKIQKVMSQNNVNIYILLKENITREFIASLIQ